MKIYFIHQLQGVSKCNVIIILTQHKNNIHIQIKGGNQTRNAFLNFYACVPFISLFILILY